MSDQIKVDITTLEQDIKSLQETLTQMNKEMAGMYESVEALSKTWSGPSHTAFTQQFQQDAQMFGEISNAVQGMIASMEQAKQEYRNCEQNVRAEIEGIRRA